MKQKKLKEAERIASLKQTAADEVKNLRGRIEQAQARIEALEEEQGSNLEAQNEIDRLKRLKKNLQTDLKNYEKEFSTAVKTQKQQAAYRQKLQKDVDKLRATYSAKVKEKNETEAGLNRTKPLDELEEQYETLEREHSNKRTRTSNRQ